MGAALAMSVMVVASVSGATLVLGATSVSGASLAMSVTEAAATFSATLVWGASGVSGLFLPCVQLLP